MTDGAPEAVMTRLPFETTEWRIRDDIVVDARGAGARSDLIGQGLRTLLDARYPVDAAMLAELAALRSRGQSVAPVVLERPEEGVDLVWFGDHGKVSGDDAPWYLLIQHVPTDRQQSLLSSASRWIGRRFAAHAPVQFFELDDDLRLTTLTPAHDGRGAGLPGNALGRRLDEFAAPEDRGDAGGWAGIRDRLGRGEAVPQVDLRSDDRHWRVSLEPVPSGRGDAPGARHRGVLIDETEVRRAQERASTSERTLRHLIDRIPIPMIVWNEHHRVTTLNPAAAELAGVTTRGAKGASMLEVARMGAVDAEEHLVLRHSTRATHGLSSPFAFTCGDGRRRWFRAATIPIDQGDRALRATLYVDVTESLERTQLLEQVKRLESLGRFASSMAHDLANVVTVVSCSIGVLERGEPDDAQEAAEDVRQALRTADEMIQRLRRVASTRNDESRAEAVQVAEVVDRCARLARSGADEPAPPIEVSVSGDAARKAVRTDPLDLERAILNLLTNATDAAGPDGTVRVGVTGTDTAVTLTVEDDGPGIPHALRTRVCDPLFTTKGERGTGLGLAQVAALVEQSGGRLRIGDSDLGGALLELELPVGREPARPERSDAPGRGDPPAGTERHRRVLVVDDHRAVRRGIVRMFRRAGWEIDEFEDAESAMLELMNGSRPDLVVSDIVMPGGMDGLDLAQWCREAAPDLPLILLSGHAPRQTDLDVAFLEKPIAESELMTLAHELVDQGA